MHLLDRQGGQYHELRPGRTTIGSSPKCTLRLEQPGVQPLHCLIVHGPEGISVRRWAPDARLNGVPFDDASIVAGDCLAIGGVEFELVKDTVDSAKAFPEAVPETFLDETDASCSRLMDAVQESVEAITELETVTDSEAAEVVTAAEIVEPAVCVEAVEATSLVENWELAEVAAEVVKVETADRWEKDCETASDSAAVEISTTAEIVEAHSAMETADIVEDVDAGDAAADVQAVEVYESDDVGMLTCESAEVGPEENGDTAEVIETFSDHMAVEADTAYEILEAPAIAVAGIVETTNAVDSDDICDTENIDQSNEVVAANEAHYTDCEASLAQVEQTVSAAKDAGAAAEFVFRELQSACAVARGRTRRMLCALRREREQNRELLERFTDIGQQLSLLKQQPPTSEPSGNFVAGEFAKWQTQWEELRQQFAVWEAKLDEHTQRMAELQQELVATRDHRPAEVAPAISAVPKSSDTTVVIPVSNAEDVAAEFVELITDSKTSPDTWSESTAVTEPESESLVEPVAEVRKSHWLEAVAPRVEESPGVADELPRSDEQSLQSGAPCEQGTATFDDMPASELALEGNTNEWEQAVSVEPSTQDGDRVSVAHEADSWAAPATEPIWAADSADAESLGERELRKSVWTMPPLPVADESNEFDAGGEAIAIEVEAPAWASGTTVERAAGEEEVSPFAEFSIWKQGASTEASTQSDSAGSDAADALPEAEASNGWANEAVSELTAVEEPQLVVDSAVEDTARSSDEVVAVPEAVAEIPAASLISPRQSQPASFIDRYAHLFEESASEGSTENSPLERPTLDNPIANGGGFSSFGVGTETATHSNEEESIEQYMAKLMQRVRGESPTNEVTPPVAAQRSARPASINVAVSGNMGANAARSSSDSVDGEAHDPTSGDASSTEAIVDWEAIARRAAAAAPKADMGALRALANETARRAIGRHELKKHRRDAMTKVIVSSLAGMTSLWLMLDSPSWRDIQFITACVSLVAAAYWAGGTFKELLESMRAATYDGPEKLQNDADSAAEPALPIDVEK